MTEWVDIDDFESIPTSADEAWRTAQATGQRERTAAPVRIVDFTSFVSQHEPSAEPLLGTDSNTILPLGGTLMMYGDGGAGKTTLTIDAVSHLASGTAWLGIPVERPVRTLLIENEGPRGKFRQRLKEKHAAWNGHQPFSPNVTVLEEPWTRFTLREPAHRESLAATVDAQEIDLVVMGPLVTLGMVGGGTPDEVVAFEELLLEQRNLIARAVSLWIVHHENKAGDISGAWERVPDALCHVQALGNGHTRLIWQKARWSDEHHKQRMDLVWADGRSFTIRLDEDADVEQELREAFAADNKWRTVKESRQLVKRREADTLKALSNLVELEEMEFQKGPKGRGATAQCYRLRGAPEAWEHLGAPTLLEGSEGATAPVLPTYKEGSREGAGAQALRTAPGDQGAPDDEAAF